ncbi:hypothetical protein GGI43DRAFT_387647 [Trichoderma evansii]
MPSANNKSSNGRKPIPLRWKFSRRFYEPILLEAALKKIRPPVYSDIRRDPNTMNDDFDSAEQTLKCYSNRLAQMCDNIRGESGATVSSIAILEEPSGPHYIIGSNGRKESKLKEVKDFVEQLLKIIAKAAERSADTAVQVKREALWHIFRFNKHRIKFYVSSSVSYLHECLADYDRRHAQEPLESEAIKFRRQLSELKDLLQFEENKELDEAQCIPWPFNYQDLSPLLTAAYVDFASCESVFRFIHLNENLNFRDSISVQAREDQINSSKRWLDLRHFLGRLHSYDLAVKTMLRARKLLGRLFNEVTVTVIPSATAIPHPLNKKRPNAHEILGRMTSAEEIMTRTRDQAEGLQPGLDEKILGECSSASQTHVVHAEILVLDYVQDYLWKTEDAKFWNNWRYIGSCKPTCRLCNYYFMAHPSGIQVRESHNNLYPHWRAPDVFDEAAMNKTESLLQAVIVKTRADAIRSLETQILQGRYHDSNSFSEMPPRSGSVRTETPSISEITSRFSSVLGRITEEDGPSAAREREDQEEEDITPLFRGRGSAQSRR